jgi:hypothetical protein
MNKTFEERCIHDPQGVIRDLVSQTTKQAKALHTIKEECKQQCIKLLREIDGLVGQQAMQDDSWMAPVEEVKQAMGITDTELNKVRAKEIEQAVAAITKPRKPRTKKPKKDEEPSLFPEEGGNHG